MASQPANDTQDMHDAWFSAAELAELGLPGLPGDKRGIARRARDERWRTRMDAAGDAMVRPRAGRGGGEEFHAGLLPSEAQLELARRGLIDPNGARDDAPVDGSWQWLERQTAKVKREAKRRAAIIAELETLERGGMSRTAAIAEICAEHRVGKSTLFNWLALIKDVAPTDRLPALAPRRKGGGVTADIDPLLWRVFKSDYLRQSAPTLTSCYARTAAIARDKGLEVPSEKTFRRRAAKIDPSVIALKRGGDETLRRSVPAERRTTDHLHALEHVNIDGHRFDVFVETPDGQVIRPTMVAIQDLYSSKILAWKIDYSETAVLTRLCFADLFAQYGIPKACTLDNGRAFASKWITGGARSRFRFKVREEEPTGLLTGLGVEVHWALPHRGQSKPIERAFRDIAMTVSTGPAMEGAYTGNRPDAKPENHGKRAVPFDQFCALVDQGIAAHNAKGGRRGRTYNGRSFDQVFEESYAHAPIRKAAPEAMRMALLAADHKTVNRQTGVIELYGNRYWSPECGRLAGRKVTVRFNPDDLGQDIHVEDEDGVYVGAAPMIVDSGFDDVAGAKRTAKRHRDVRQAAKKLAEAEQLLSAEQLAAMQPVAPVRDVPQPSVIRPVQHRRTAGAAAAARKPEIETREEISQRIFGALRLIQDDE